MAGPAFICRVINVAADTSGGVVQYTSPGMGTPVGAIVIGARTTAGGTIQTGWSQSWGCTDGTTQLSCSSNSRDAVATGVSKASGSNASLVRMHLASTNALIAEATFNAFITDGIELNWTTPAPLGGTFPITIILFGGTACQCYANAATPPVTTGATTITPGFAADVVFTHTMASTNNTQLNQADYGPGFVIKNGGSPINYGIQMLCDRGTTSQARTIFNNTDLGETITLGATDTLSGISRINNFTSTTFDLVNSNSVQGPMFATLAVKVGGAGVAVHEDVCPTSTGNQAYTFPGFRTGFLYCLFTNNTTAAKENDAHGGVGVSDMRGGSGSASAYGKSGVSTSKTSSLADSAFVDLYNVDRTEQYKASVVSIDATGHTLNFSVVPASGRKFFSLVFEDVYLLATGTSAGATAVSGTLLGVGSLVGSSAGATAVSGTIKGAGALTGTAAGATAASGTLLGVGALSGTAAGSTAASGTLLGSAALAGTSAGATSATATLLGVGALVGSSAGATAVSGTLTGTEALTGTSAGATAASGTLVGQGALSGTSAGATAATGVLVTQNELIGAAAGSTSASGLLTGTAALAGEADGATAVSGILLATEAITGTAAGSTTVAGLLSGLAALAGTAAGSTTPIATLLGSGALVGAASGLTTVHGSLAVPGINCPVDLDGGFKEQTELEAGYKLSSELDGGYNRIGNLEGTTC